MRMRLGNHLADHGRKLASTRQDNIQQTKGEGRFTNPEVDGRGRPYQEVIYMLIRRGGNSEQRADAKQRIQRSRCPIVPVHLPGNAKVTAKVHRGLASPTVETIVVIAEI